METAAEGSGDAHCIKLHEEPGWNCKEDKIHRLALLL